jgi:hypothetical protein
MSIPAIGRATRTPSATVGARPASEPVTRAIDRAEAGAALWHYGARLGSTNRTSSVSS